MRPVLLAITVLAAVAFLQLAGLAILAPAAWLAQVVLETLSDWPAVAAPLALVVFIGLIALIWWALLRIMRPPAGR